MFGLVGFFRNTLVYFRCNVEKFWNHTRSFAGNNQIKNAPLFGKRRASPGAFLRILLHEDVAVRRGDVVKTYSDPSTEDELTQVWSYQGKPSAID